MIKRVNIGDITLVGDTYHDVEAEFLTYQMSPEDNPQPAILLWADGELLATATVNVGVPGIFIKDYSENAGLLEQLEEKGLVVPTGHAVTSGWVQIPEVTLAGAFAEAVA